MVSTVKKSETTPGFVGREELLEQLYKEIQNKEAAVVLKGPSGVGKTAVLEKIEQKLNKEGYQSIVFHGAVMAEMVLEQLATLAEKKGVQECADIYRQPISFKEKLAKLSEHFLYKSKVLFIFEDFHRNLETDGQIANERFKELIHYLKDELKDKESVMLFATTDDIVDFQAHDVALLNWSEFSRLVAKTQCLARLNKKSLKSIHFELGGYPQAVLFLECIASLEFGEKAFQWPELREKVPGLNRAVMHKESETADFSYLLLDKLLEQLGEKDGELLETFSIYRGWVPGTATHASGLEIKPAVKKRLEQLFQVKYFRRGAKTGYRVPYLVSRTIRAKLDDQQLKKMHIQAAEYLGNIESETPAPWGEHRLESIWHYLEAGEINKAALMIFEADVYFCQLGFPQMAFDLLVGLESQLACLDSNNELHAHTRLGVMYSLFGKLDEAVGHHERSYNIFIENGNLAGAAVQVGQVGMIYEAKGKYHEALEALSKSKELLEKLGSEDIVQLALRCQQMGSIYKRQGDYEKAFEAYNEALELDRRNDNTKAIAHDLEQLGRIHDEQAKFDEALDYYGQSIHLKKESGDRSGVAGLTHQVGNVYFVKGDLSEANRYYRDALDMNLELKDYKSAGYSRGQIGLILQREGKEDDALEYFKQSLADFEAADEKKGMAAGHHQIGRIYQGRGEIDIALEHYTKATGLREETGDMLGLAITYGQLGLLFYEKEEYETSLRYSVQAYAIFTRYGSPNVQLARQNMLRLQSKLPKETFEKILEEYHVKTGKDES